MSVLDTYDSLNKTSKRMKIRILDDAADPRVLRCIIFVSECNIKSKDIK